MKKNTRKIEIAVISDIHLGTYGCHAKELLWYLKSIKPGILVLNGDIMDIWQFSKRYWPKSHMKVVKQIMNMTVHGVKTYYVTGNHDEMLRKFTGMKLGSLRIVNELKLDLPGGKAWFFHGDVFDMVIQHSKWLARLGSLGYDSLILLNAAISFVSTKLGNRKVAMSKKIKDNVKSAVSYINNFEQTAARAGYRKGCRYVICGHIHQAQQKDFRFENGEVTYLNSGDWIENLTALEYNSGNWSIYEFNKDTFIEKQSSEDQERDYTLVDLPAKEHLKNMLFDFQN